MITRAIVLKSARARVIRLVLRRALLRVRVRARPQRLFARLLRRRLLVNS